MNILYISFYFPPFNTMGGIRAAGQVKELEKAGHKVKVLSSNFQGDFGELSLGPFDVNLYQVSGIHMQKNKSENLATKSFKTVLRNIIVGNKNFPFREFLFYAKDFLIFKYGLQKRWRKMVLDDLQSIKNWQPEIIFASYSPLASLKIAADLSKVLAIPYFAEMRDSWSFNPMVSFKNENNLLSKILRRFEKKLLHNCSGIISSTSFIEEYYSSYLPLIPNKKIYGGFDNFNQQPGNTLINRLGKKFVITHAGSLLQGRKSPEILFKAIASNEILKQNFAINFFGHDQDAVMQLAKRYSIEKNVLSLGAISYLDCKKSEEDSDILLVLMQNNDNEKYAVTGKVFDLIKLKKDILMIYGKKSEAEEIVINSGLGMALDNENDIRDYLLRFISNQDKNVQANHHFIESLSRKNQISLMIEFIKQNT